MGKQDDPVAKWTTGDYVGLFGGIAGFIAAIAALLAWDEARESRKIAAEAHALSQKSYDRAAGKFPAKFAIVGLSPRQDQLPAQLKFRIDGQDELRLTGLDHLRLLNPRLLVKNTGQEPIEAFRLEAKTVFAGAEFGGEVRERQFAAMAEWRHGGHSELEEVPLARKVQPGETVSLPLIRTVLGRLTRLRDAEALDANNYGRFEIKCYARGVGVSSFDEAEGRAINVVRLVWIPKGFPEDDCKRFLEAERFTVEDVPAK